MDDSLLDVLEIGLVELDASGRVVRASASAQRLLGLDDSVLGAVLPVRLDGSTDLDIEGRRVRAQARPLPGGGHAVALHDITEDHHELERLRARQAATERESELKSTFLANMSHEIRTPLNGVLGMTDLLLLSELTADQRNYVETARDSGRSLLQLLNAVLDYAKLEAGRMQVERTEFRPDELLERTLRPLRASARVPVALHLDEAVPSMLRGDPIRLGQVLANLVGNAIKFTDQGQVTVTAEYLRALPDGALLRFEVEDTGIGISSAAMARLFEPFTQADTSTTRRFGGTGLGLAISRQLVELMGGTLEARSEPGKGSRFWFTLPFQLAEASLDELLESTPRARVLVAEDNQVNRLVATRLLEQLGCQAVEVQDGRAAVERARRGDLDLVLMDCQMPEMDGFQAAAAMRAEGITIPIVAVTASDVEDDRDRLLACGMNAMLQKPLAQVALRAVLARLLPR